MDEAFRGEMALDMNSDTPVATEVSNHRESISDRRGILPRVRYCVGVSFYRDRRTPVHCGSCVDCRAFTFRIGPIRSGPITNGDEVFKYR